MRFVERDEASPKLGEFTSSELRVFAAINQQIAGAGSLRAILRYLFDATRELMPCDRLSLAFVEDRTHLIARHVVASYEPLVLKEGYVEELGASSLRGVLSSALPRVIDDLEIYANKHPESVSTRMLLAEGVRSSMTCPLLMNREVVGLLFRSSRQPGAYTERHARLQQAISQRLAQAVEKVHRIEQLDRALADYRRMLRFVTEQLEGSLTSMMVDVHGLIDGRHGELSAQQGPVMARLVERGDQLYELIKDYRDLERIETQEMHLRVQDTVKLEQQVVLPAMEILRSELAFYPMEVEVHLPTEEVGVECDPELLTSALVNLLSNALKYGAHGGHVEIVVAHKDGGFELSVHNDGPGFSPRARGEIFRKFKRLDEARLSDRAGTGLGLFTVNHIARLHGGQVFAESEPGQYARVGLFVPQPLAPK